MRTIKVLGMKAVSSSNLSQLRSNVAVAAAAGAASATAVAGSTHSGNTITYHNDTVRSVKSVIAVSTPSLSVSGRPGVRHHHHQLVSASAMGTPASAPRSGKRSTPSSVKRRNKVARRDSAKRILAYNSQR